MKLLFLFAVLLTGLGGLPAVVASDRACWVELCERLG